MRKLLVVALVLAGAEFDLLDRDPCAGWEHKPGCSQFQSSELLNDQALAPFFELVGQGDELLWIDERGNVGFRIPVERIVYFDKAGRPIGRVSGERCTRSVENTLPKPSAIVCLGDDRLRQVIAPEVP